MTDDTKPTPVQYASFRVYVQASGRYKAFGVVERADAPVPKAVFEGSEESTPGAALASVLSVSGFLES